MSQTVLLAAPRRLPSADDALDLMVALGDDLRSLELPGLRCERPPVPPPEALVAWSAEARARVEAAVAEIDDARVRERDVRRAARRTIAALFGWTRRSLAPWSSERGVGLLGSYLRRGEIARWEALAGVVADRAAGEPAAVDRFLDVYIEMARGAAEVGLASLLAPAEPEKS